MPYLASQTEEIAPIPSVDSQTHTSPEDEQNRKVRSRSRSFSGEISLERDSADSLGESPAIPIPHWFIDHVGKNQSQKNDKKTGKKGQEFSKSDTREESADFVGVINDSFFRVAGRRIRTLYLFF